MKVLICCEFLGASPTGIGHYTAQLVKVLSTAPELEITALLSRENADLGLPPNVRRLVAAKKAVPGLPIFRTARREMERFDVVHYPRAVPSFWGRLERPATVMTIHDVMAVAWPEHPHRGERFYFRRVLPGVLPKIDFIVADSAYSKSDFLEHYRFNEANTRVVPLFSRWETLNPQEVQSSKEPFFLALGSIEPRKNLPLLLEAFAEFTRLHPQLPHKLLVVGYERERKETIGIAAGKHGRVEWLNYVDDDRLRGLLRSATALVFPSLYEGFGLPVLEAMSQGCPVIASSASSIPEVGGDAVIYVDPGDPSAIQNAMSEMMDVKHAGALIDRALVRAQTFSPGRFLDEMRHVYAAALQKHRNEDR